MAAHFSDSPFRVNKFSFYSDEEADPDSMLFNDPFSFPNVEPLNSSPPLFHREAGPFHEQPSPFFESGPLFHHNQPEAHNAPDSHLREPSPFHRSNEHNHNFFPFSDDNSFCQEQQDPQMSHDSRFQEPFVFTKPFEQQQPQPHQPPQQQNYLFPKTEPGSTSPKAVHGSEPSFVAPPPMSATHVSPSPMDSSLISDHWTDTSPIRTERADRMDEMCDADKYLHNGLEDIDQALQYHFSGRQFPRHVSKRAKELFKRSYELQSQQKDGDVAFRRNRGDSGSRRKRFARRKAFVVTSIVVALKEFGLSLNGRMRQSDSQAIASLSETVSGGSKIRLTSVKSCCRTLSLTDIRFR